MFVVEELSGALRDVLWQQVKEFGTRANQGYHGTIAMIFAIANIGKP